MPRCASQCILCDLPIRFDTYEGCSHGCEYCFAKKFKDISKVQNYETVSSLKNFVEGKRTRETNWCDWDIPLHWGGLSDPFQPCEKQRKISLECLKYLKQTQYPFVVSTKGKLAVQEPYLTLLSECNCVVQISAVCSSYDKLELGCPTYLERLQMAKILSEKCKRVIIRIQPYMHEVFDEVYSNLDKIKKAGVYGVIIEGMKYKKKKSGLIKVAGDYTYPYDVILSDFIKLKDKAHKLGLKIYAGENRIRVFGDSLSCCGIDGLEGFIPNKFNLNHLVNGDKPKPTEKMKEKGTSCCFKGIDQTPSGSIKYKNQSFGYSMLEFYKNKTKLVEEIFGRNTKKH